MNSTLHGIKCQLLSKKRTPAPDQRERGRSTSRSGSGYVNERESEQVRATPVFSGVLHDAVATIGDDVRDPALHDGVALGVEEPAEQLQTAVTDASVNSSCLAPDVEAGKDALVIGGHVAPGDDEPGHLGHIMQHELGLKAQSELTSRLGGLDGLQLGLDEVLEFLPLRIYSRKVQSEDMIQHLPHLFRVDEYWGAMKESIPH